MTDRVYHEWVPEENRWKVVFIYPDGTRFAPGRFAVEENAITEAALYNEYYASKPYANASMEMMEKTPIGQKINLWEDLIFIKRGRGLPV